MRKGVAQESFCHYKFKDYTRRRDALRLRDSGAWLPPSYAVIAAAVLLSALATCMAFPWNLCVGLLSLWVFAAFLGEVRSRPQAREAFHRFADTAANWGRIAFDFLIYKWLFGYGVYPLRVLMTAVGTILIFALIYGAATWHADENVGYPVVVNVMALKYTSRLTATLAETGLAFSPWAALSPTALAAAAIALSSAEKAAMAWDQSKNLPSLRNHPIFLLTINSTLEYNSTCRNGCLDILFPRGIIYERVRDRQPMLRASEKV